MGCCIAKSKKCTKYSNAGCDDHPVNVQEESHYHEIEEVVQQKNKEQEKQQDNKLTWTQGELLGQGAFGRVVMGMNRVSGQIMAVKQVYVKTGDENKVSSLQREIEILSILQHPHIVRYYGTETKNDQLNIFLEYVSGGSVLTMIKRFGKFKESLIKVYLKQILSGLSFLHSKNVIHRDIKGANILINQDGKVKLADFGSGKYLSEISQNIIRSLQGTPNYMAPEVINQEQYGKKADIWSLGCTMIEMATGHPPFYEIKNIYAVMVTISKLTQMIPIPEELKSQNAKDFLRKCLALNPIDRWDADQLMQHPFLTNQERRESNGPNSAQVNKNNSYNEEINNYFNSAVLPKNNQKQQFSFQLDADSQEDQSEKEIIQEQGQGSQKDDPVTNVIQIKNNKQNDSETDQGYHIIIEQNFDDQQDQFVLNQNNQNNKKILTRQSSLNQALNERLNDVYQTKSLKPF